MDDYPEVEDFVCLDEAFQIDDWQAFSLQSRDFSLLQE